jgi:hypothetical protein
MTLAGDVLDPGLITRRGTDHSDASRASCYESMAKYSSEKAFVTRSLFRDYSCIVVLPFIQTIRTDLRNLESPAILILDGHKSHMSQLIGAFAAEHGITLFLLPLYSNDLLQSLDQGFFLRVKVQFGQLPRIQ